MLGRELVGAAQVLVEAPRGVAVEGRRLADQVLGGLEHDDLAPLGLLAGDAARHELGIEAVAAFLEVTAVGHLRDDVGRAQQAFRKLYFFPTI